MEQKKLSALLRGMTSEPQGEFYCLNCLHFFATENKCESDKKSCENKDFKLRIKVSMLSEDTEILAFNQYQNCHKAVFIIYTDLECLLEKIAGFKNKPQS